MKLQYFAIGTWAGIAATLISSCSWAPAPVLTPNPEPAEHVIVILIDTLRADHLPIYGYSENTAPFLNSLAEEATVFTHTFSTSSYTPEAVGSIFTGAYPSATPTGAGWYARPDTGRETLAPHFRKRGYRTALFSASPVIKQPEFFRGFEQSKCYTEFGVSGQSGLLVMEALQWLQAHEEEDTFLYLHFLDPHAPFDPPEELRAQFDPAPPANPLDWLQDVRPHLPALLEEGFGPGEARFEDLVARYDAEIRLVDEAIEALFDGMDTLGMTKDALVVVTADHGEEFLEHGFIEHAWRLYPETLHVPLLIWRPGVVPVERNDTYVSIVDIFPTLMALQETSPPELAMNGRTLFSKNEKGIWSAAPQPRPLISELIIQSRSIVRTVLDPPWFYVASPKWLSPEASSAISETQRTIRQELLDGTREHVDSWAPPVHEELYRLDRDPGAQENLLDEAPETLAKMRKLLKEYQAECPVQISDQDKQRAQGSTPPFEEERQKLESLGYSGGSDTASGTASGEFATESLQQDLESLGYL